MLGSDYSFRIHIEYLAERIKPGFKTFDVVLSDVAQLQFVPWLRDLDAEKEVLSDLLEIFGGQPDIHDGSQPNELWIIAQLLGIYVHWQTAFLHISKEHI